MLTSPVLFARQVQKIRANLPASTHVLASCDQGPVLSYPQVQVKHTSGNRLCSNSSTYSRNFKGLRSEARWIPEAQGKLLKARSPKCYKSSGGIDVIPD